MIVRYSCYGCGHTEHGTQFGREQTVSVPMRYCPYVKCKGQQMAIWIEPEAR